MILHFKNIILCFFVFLAINAQRSSFLKKINRAEDKVYEVSGFRDFNQNFMNKQNNVKVLMVTTGESLASRCQFCGQFEMQFRVLSKEYYKDYKNDLVFSIFHFEESEDKKQVLRELQIESVPTILIYHYQSSTPKKCDIINSQLTDCIKQANPKFIEPKAIKKMLEQTRELQRGGSHKLNFKGYIYLGSTAIILLLSFLIIKKLLNNTFRFLVCIGCFGTFVVCAGGLVYTLIQSPTSTMGGSMFYPVQRQQLKYEGYIGMLFVVGFALFWIIITEYYPKIQTIKSRKEEEKIEEEKKKIISFPFLKEKPMRPMAKRNLAYGLFMGMNLCFLCFFHFWIVKYGFYMQDTKLYIYGQIIRALPIGEYFKMLD